MTITKRDRLRDYENVWPSAFEVEIFELKSEIVAEEGPIAEIEYALPGHTLHLDSGSYIRLDDISPPYTSDLWANTVTGKLVAHWSSFISEIKP